jgi:AraC-like DNA-binding protein
MLPKKHLITSTSNIEETIEGIRTRSQQFTHIDAKPAANWKYEFRRLSLGSVRLGTSTATHVSYKQGFFDDILIAGTLSGTERMRRGRHVRAVSSLASFVPLATCAGDVIDANVWTVRLSTNKFIDYIQAHDLETDPVAWIDEHWLTPNRGSSLFGQFMAHSLALINELDSDLNQKMIRSVEDLFYVNSVILLKAGESRTIPSANMRLFRRVIDYIENDIKQDLTLLAISRAVGASIRSVQYAVRHEAGVTLTALILERRLLRARRLLETSERGTTVQHVCEMVGFDNPSYFSKVYRTRFGESPRQTLANN